MLLELLKTLSKREKKSSIIKTNKLVEIINKSKKKTLKKDRYKH